MQARCGSGTVVSEGSWSRVLLAENHPEPAVLQTLTRWALFFQLLGVCIQRSSYPFCCDVAIQRTVARKKLPERTDGDCSATCAFHSFRRKRTTVMCPMIEESL